MKNWSGIRHKLENEYLAESLRGHITYYCTTYKKSNDEEGRAAIRLDGKELISGSYWNNWAKISQFPKDETYEKRVRQEFAFLDETALKLGIFDQRCFYSAFEEFDNQSIDKSMESDNLIVRIFSVLDRRIGKRRLTDLRDHRNPEEEIFNLFLSVRLRAENIPEPV